MDKGIIIGDPSIRGYNLSRIDCGSSVNQVAPVLSADLRAVRLEAAANPGGS